MVIGTEYGQEWRDSTKPTKYPFTDSAELSASTGRYIDHTSIYDASFYIVNWVSRLYITSIIISSAASKIVTINIGDAENLIIASAELPASNIPSEIFFTDTSGRPAGIMIVDPIAFSFIQTWDIGEHIFENTAEFVPFVIMHMPSNGVSSFKDGSNNIVSGEVWLVGENGVVVRTEGKNIRVDVVGDPLFKRRVDSSFITPRFIKTINGIPPNEFGDFKIVSGSYMAGDTILRVYPEPDVPGIRIELVGQSLETIV